MCRFIGFSLFKQEFNSNGWYERYASSNQHIYRVASNFGAEAMVEFVWKYECVSSPPKMTIQKFLTAL